MLTIPPPPGSPTFRERAPTDEIERLWRRRREATARHKARARHEARERLEERARMAFEMLRPRREMRDASAGGKPSLDQIPF